MLTRHEYNQVYFHLQEYTIAWERYVKAVQAQSLERYGLGSAVKDQEETLQKLLKTLV